MSDRTKFPHDGASGNRPAFVSHVEDLGPAAAESICAGMLAANDNVSPVTLLKNTDPSIFSETPRLHLERPLGRLLGESKDPKALEDVLSQLRSLCMSQPPEKPAPVFEVIKGARDER